MDFNKYAQLREKHIEQERKKLDILGQISFEDFKEIQIDINIINSEEDLNLDPSLNNSSVLYYFTIIESENFEVSKQIIKEASRLKSRKTNKMMLPQVNKVRENLPFQTLYVGKCNSNFYNRILYHLGLKSQKTYALHLTKWTQKINLKVVLHYAIVDLEPELISYLESLESVIHHSLKPILGRVGH